MKIIQMALLHFFATLFSSLRSRRSGLKSFALSCMLFFSLSSCIQIDEIWKINRDGSGSFSIHFSMKEVINFISAIDPTGSGKEKMDAAFDSAMTKLNDDFIKEVSKCPGISSVFVKGDPENFSIEYGYSFSGIKELNQSLNKSMEMSSGLGDNPMNSLNFTGAGVKYIYENNKFIKDFPSNYLSTLPEDSRNKIEEAKKQLEMMKSPGFQSTKESAMVNTMIELFDYSIRYEFEQTVNKVSDKAATISPDKHSVVLNCELEKLFNGDLYKDLKITLK